ncbi:MAG: peroxiredoxin [Pseudomonadota bacterium]
MTDLHTVDWSAIPAPVDDGAANHLVGMPWPAIELESTDGINVDLSKLPGRSLVYAYPMTGRPGTPLPDGWDQIPGARGCTPQSCAFRDHSDELRRLGVSGVYGISTQRSVDQQEAAERLHLPFALLSDSDLQLARGLNLPVFRVGDATLLRRITLVIDDGTITKMFYPVFPPDENAQAVIDWLQRGG